MSQMFNNDPYYTLSEMVEQTGYNRSTLDNKVRQLVKELDFQEPNEERQVPIKNIVSFFFAPFASLREIFRDSVAAPPRLRAS